MLIGGEQADGGNVGCQIERVGSERALRRLAPVGGEGEYSLGGVAVELDVDVGKPDRAAHHIGLRLDREVAESAAGQRLLSGPDQGIAHRCGIGGARAFALEGGLGADGDSSEKATAVSVSSTLFSLLRTSTVPFSMRISENAAPRGPSLVWLRVSA